MIRRSLVSIFFIGGCSLVLQKQPFCGDGVAQDGEVCFQREDLASQPFPTTALVIDLDADNDLDIVNSNLGGVISFFPNDGEGGFDDFVIIPTAASPNQVVASDLNADGRLDLAVACAGFPDAVTGFPDGVLTVLLQQADGSFLQQDIPQAAFVNFASLALGDLNNDGAPDLVLASQQNRELRFLQNDGNGGFIQLFAPLALPSTPFGLTVADLDADGLPELLVSELFDENGGFGNSLFLFSVQALAVQAPPIDIPLGLSPVITQVGDMDGDGLLDIVASNLNSNDVRVLLQAGPLVFVDAIQLSAGLGPVGLVLNDFNQDDQLDIISTAVNSDQVFFHQNIGEGAFTTLQPFAVGKNPEFLDAGDLDGDGTPEVVVPNTDLQTGSNIVSILRSAR